MKVWINRTILGGVLAACLLGVSSCSGEIMSAAAESAVSPDAVPAAVYEDFRQSFPDAADAVWSVADGYAVVTFTEAGTRSAAGRTSVWYGLKDAEKKMLYRAIAFDALPEAVRDAFAAGEYGAAELAAAGVLTRYASGTVETLYVLRVTVENTGDVTTEATLYYTADGILVKLTVESLFGDDRRDDIGTGCGDWLPQTPPDCVAAFVDLRYPDAEYLYVHVGRSGTEVKILDGRHARMLLFDADGSWISTRTQLHADELPEAVLSAFSASEYADCRIAGAEERETADGLCYVLTVKDSKGGKREIGFDEFGAPVSGGNGGAAENPGTGGDGACPDAGPVGEYVCRSQEDVAEFVGRRYPDAVLVDMKFDDKRAEAELACGGDRINVRFDRCTQGYVWVRSERDIDIRCEESVPASVRATVEGSYADYRLCYLKYVEMPSEGDWYEAGLKSASRGESVEIRMDEFGNLLSEYVKH